MATETIITVILPLCIAFIMFGFGLSLALPDFKRILNRPKSVLIGLSCQMLFLPVLAIIIAKVFQLPRELAIGLMILAASPGGTMANIFSHFAEGDIVLNLTLTALNSILSVFTLPLLVNLAFVMYSDGSQEIGLQFRKSLEVFSVVVIPVSLGMIAKRFWPTLGPRLDKPLRVFSAVLLILIIAGAIAKEWTMLSNSFMEIGFAILAFNLGSLAFGYGVPTLLKLPKQECTAIAMEVSVHNSALAIYISITILKSYPIAMPSAIYSPIMFITAGLLSAYLMRKKRQAGATHPVPC